MDCPLQRGNGERLLDLCAGRLRARDAGELAEHLAACPDCARFAAAQKAVWSHLDAWEAPPVSVEFNRRLYAAIEREQDVSFLRRWFRRVQAVSTPVNWRPALSATAACFTLLVAAWIGFSNEPGPGAGVAHMPAATQIRVENVDLDQVERALDDVDLLQNLGKQGPAKRSAVSAM